MPYAALITTISSVPHDVGKEQYGEEQGGEKNPGYQEVGMYVRSSSLHEC